MQRRGQGRRRIRASLRQASASCRNGAVKGDAEIAAAARLRRLPDLRAPDSPRRVKNTQSPPRPRADLRRHRTGLVAGSQQHANKAQVVQLAPFARGITLPRRAAFVCRRGWQGWVWEKWGAKGGGAQWGMELRGAAARP
eukprot:scaffold9665_cov104-Isochrysis_galbana.AAC.3